MAKAKTSSKPIKGNIFEFYVPKIHGSKPRPKQVTDKKDPTKKVYDKSKPANFLKNSFEKTTNVPFGSGSKKNLSARYPALLLPQIVHAALECGYGRTGMWSSHLLLTHKESLELASYLLKRLLMVASCIKVDKNDAYFTQEFYSKIEPSEKVAISFIAGGIGSFIAAYHWLAAAGEKINVMLHTSIYTKGLSPSVKTNPLTTKKSPDYLIESDSGEWHIFESKGGTDAGRHKRIQEGLLQLGAITQLAWASPTLTRKQVQTNVCTHTCIDAGSRLKVLAYDPPGENTEEGQTIILDEAVCKLLKIVESLDQFHVLGTEVSTEDGWEWKTVPQINNLRVALPSQYFDLEEKLRTRLGLYFLATESVEKYKKIAQWPIELTILTIVGKITAYKFEDKNHAIAEEFRRFVLELNEVEEPTIFITYCRQHLNLDETFSEFIAVLEKVIIQPISSKNPHNEIKNSDVLTSSGMLIREMNDIE
ncbi:MULTISPECIES: hypothetical protein [Pectobacterium]|uniref:hypothetical protein n=1 Tax=Pectobacterium TaxID=122277 RepID=UPI0011AF755E|nr:MULTISPECIES: hypothetical protein [Pectobacterium]MBB1527358.1 hypothetical protein [Pectobacterium carotovorum subsp. carotovorum]